MNEIAISVNPAAEQSKMAKVKTILKLFATLTFLQL